MLRVSVQSVQYVLVAVTPTGSDEQDPSGGQVLVAFKPEGATPTTPDWVAAQWDTTTWPPQARVLVGPGTNAALTPGEYVVWVKFGAGLETPVIPAGPLEAY